MTDAAISVRNLDHFFGEGEARKQALFDINLEIRRGTLTILMGPSGSGKTTLLTIMGCLREVQAGRIRLLDEELSGSGRDLPYRHAPAPRLHLPGPQPA